MLPPTWVRIWDRNSARNRGLDRTPRAWCASRPDRPAWPRGDLGAGSLGTHLRVPTRRWRRRAGGVGVPSSPRAAGRRVAGSGPNGCGSAGTLRRDPGGIERGEVAAGRGDERLVVGHAAVIRGDELDQLVLAVGADEEVDRGDALGVGEAEPLVGRREQARRCRPGASGCRSAAASCDLGPVTDAVALREVHRETLVEPARREVVRVGRPRRRTRCGSARGSRACPPSPSRPRSAAMLPTIVRMAGLAWPPTCSRAPGARAPRNASSVE